MQTTPLYCFVEIFSHQFSWFVEVKEGELFVGSAVQQVLGNPQLVGDSFVLPREEAEKAEMAAVVPDVFGDLVVGLVQVNDTAIPVPAIDEIVYDVVLVLFANQVVEHDDFFGKVAQERLILVLVEVFRKEKDFVEHQQISILKTSAGMEGCPCRKPFVAVTPGS